jgi:NAD(P)-dependent dehydrogenase (short-subunit alcohol dehydrogenase family)
MSEVRDRVAFVTGGASGIGLGIAKALLGAGAKVVIADLRPDHLDEARAVLAAHDNRLLGIELDVTERAAMAEAADRVEQAFGRVDILVNNAGIGIEGPLGEASYADWDFGLAVNLGGVINGLQTFVPAMLAQKTPGAVINTGSKQGITCPPGDTAYNVSKAGVKVLTEGLAHSLRNEEGARLTAHLLIPGSTFTGMTSRGRTEKPAGAWTPDQVIDLLVTGMAQNEFYILCPDNEVTREVDHRRILWAANDIVASRPALSRWHADYKDAFEQFLQATE